MAKELGDGRARVHLFEIPLLDCRQCNTGTPPDFAVLSQPLHLEVSIANETAALKERTECLEQELHHVHQRLYETLLDVELKIATMENHDPLDLDDD